MQTRQFSFKKSIWIQLAIAAFSLLIISSCKSKKKYTLLEDRNCKIRLTSAEINDAWVKPGYTDPKNANFIDSIDIISVYDPISNIFTVYLQGLKKGAVTVSQSRIKIYEGDICHPPADISIAPHNYFKLWDLNIFKPDGKLNNFNYVSFKPQKYSKDDNIMSFEWAVDGPVAVGILAKGESFPCPPCQNCKPIPEGCIIVKDSAIDNGGQSVSVDSINNK